MINKCTYIVHVHVLQWSTKYHKSGLCECMYCTCTCTCTVHVQYFCIYIEFEPIPIKIDLSTKNWC